jgi:hypothetical protein
MGAVGWGVPVMGVATRTIRATRQRFIFFADELILALRRKSVMKTDCEMTNSELSHRTIKRGRILWLALQRSIYVSDTIIISQVINGGKLEKVRNAASFNKEVWFPYALQHPDPAVIQPEDADKYQDALARMLRDSMESDPDFWNA